MMKKPNNSGFTFVELTIVIGLSAIVLGIIMTFWIFWEKTFKSESIAEGAAHQDVRLALGAMIDDLHCLDSLKEFKDDTLSFSRFVSTGSGSSGAKITVTWEIGENEKGQPVLRRVEEMSEKVWVGRYGEVAEIKKDAFTGYCQNINDHSFSIFDTYAHDTADLAKITMIKIHLSVLPTGKDTEDDKENRRIDFITRVGLRYIRNRLIQPYWNFRS